MNLSSLKKDKVLLLLTGFFIAWISFLISMLAFASRDVTFYDALAQIDVSPNYTSVMPVTRYFIEPFVGLTMTTAKGFFWVLTAIYLYVIARIVYHLFLKKRFRKSQKFRVLAQIMHNYIKFFVYVVLFLLLGVSLFLGIGAALGGFLFLDYYWQVTLQITVYILSIAALIKLIWIVFRYFRPKKNMTFTNEKKPPKGGSGRKAFRQFRKEFRAFLGFNLLLIMVLLLFMRVPFPTHRIETDLASDEYLFDFHVHTTMSDGFLSPEDRVRWYMDANIDGAAFTDHENQRGYEVAKSYVDSHGLDFYPLRGEEYTSTYIHMNYYGLDEVIVPPEAASPGATVMNVSDFIIYVKSQGGYVIVNHYYTNASAEYKYEDLRDWGVDGFEIVNNALIYPLEIRQFCLDNNLICIGGSDIHTNQELNTFVKITLNDPGNLTHIFETLKNNTHEVVAIDFYGVDEDFQSPLGIFDGFIIWFNYFLTLDLFQILSWICWSAGGFVLLLFIYKLFKKSDVKKLKEVLK